jgi:hypothetical protein
MAALVLYFSSEYQNSGQNIIIMFAKILFIFRSEAWLSLLVINKSKLFAESPVNEPLEGWGGDK